MEKKTNEERENTSIVGHHFDYGYSWIPKSEVSNLFHRHLETYTYNRDYWSTKWPFNNRTFSSIMSGRRLELLMSYLHLNNNESQPTRGSPHYDKLNKVRPYFDALVSNFRTAYTPQQNLSIDESIISYKGRLSWIQYMPRKPNKWGMKAWCLADLIMATYGI